MPGRQGQQDLRQEQGQPDIAEIDRIMRQVIDGPADRHHHHRHRQAGDDAGDDEQAEFAQRQDDADRTAHDPVQAMMSASGRAASRSRSSM